MSENNGQEDDFADDWAAAFGEQQEIAKSMAEAAKPAPAPFQDFGPADDPADFEKREDINLDVILDVPVTITMQVGHTRINIRNLLQLTQGSVVELDRLAGEPMDVLVNGTLIAHGEVVVVNDKFGIRLTDVLSPAERVKKLR
jgi:flagellar motor switch protein FliN